jgi:hypothetical protein
MGSADAGEREMLSPSSGQMIAAWFSCGAASAVAAKQTIEKYGSICDIRVVYNPVIEEDPDNLRFLNDVQDWLGVKVEIATNPKFPSCSAKEVWEKYKYMSGVVGAPCTLHLKKNARVEWEKANKPDYHVLGFTYEEKNRYDNFILSERNNVLPILIDSRTSKAECFAIINNAGIKLPRIYDLGYPNANCVGCVKAGSVSYWNLVREKHPEVFKDRAEQSRRLGTKLVVRKGKRIFLDELLATDKGYRIKSMHIECGIFCEEKR